MLLAQSFVIPEGNLESFTSLRLRLAVYRHFYLNLLSLAAKESSKERPLLAPSLRGPKERLRAVILRRYSAVWRWFLSAGGMLSGFVLSFHLLISVLLYQACPDKKKAPSWVRLETFNWALLLGSCYAGFVYTVRFNSDELNICFRFLLGGKVIANYSVRETVLIL